MVFFLENDDFAKISSKEVNFIPIMRLGRKDYIAIFITHLLTPDEKDKMYKIFCDKTEFSNKTNKKVIIKDQRSANILGDRMMTMLKKMQYRNKVLSFTQMLPNMEIIEWPGDTFFTGITYNSITKNKYIPSSDDTMIATIIIPILNTDTNTQICRLGKSDISDPDPSNCVCKNQNGCCCHTPICQCLTKCGCHNCSLNITGGFSLFYLSDLEPIDIYGEKKLNLYIHAEYSYS